jgi:glycine cleavage system H protein
MADAKLRFTKDHEWIRVEGADAVVGITDFAQSQLGDVVFVEVPAAGKQLKAGGEAAVVESVKAASEVYAPVSGTVIEGNAALPDAPETVNADPLGKGWFFKVKLSNPAELDGLMDQAAYDKFVAELH